MANLAAALKEEIRRLARREIKAETGATKQAVAQYRRRYRPLERQLRDQEKRIALLQGQDQKRCEEAGPAAEAVENFRFSPRSVKARARLGLSAADYAKLVGVTQLTIYNWEKGKTRPRPRAVRDARGHPRHRKREAMRRLQAPENNQ